MNSSGRVRVLIGTSEGPVEILWLRREGQVVRRSQVTVGGATKDAGISRGYDAFVAERTGVIQRLFDDTRAYRAEVSAKIDAGSSWQLGFFVAHALAASDRFANAEQTRNATLWATGKVRTDDLSVGEIGYLARKLASSLAILKAAAVAGERVIIVFPAGNADQLGPSLRKELASIGVEIVEAKTVVDVVRKLDLPAIALAADGKPWTGSPFLGLKAFQPEHRDVFFGRDRAREEVLDRLRDAAKGEFAFLLIHGRSGCGKSSLVRAGLIGDVAIQASEADVWRSYILSPGLNDGDPFAGLIATLANALPEASAALLCAGPDTLVTLVQQALAGGASGKVCKLLLVVDQLEELLIGDSTDGREAFAEAIEALAASGVVWVVATLRSDLLPRIKESPALARLCSDDRLYWLEQPNRTELRDIIRRPAAAARLSLEGSDLSGQPLLEVLIGAAAASMDSLPLLQFVLAYMFAIEGAEGRLSFTTYEKLGKLEGAIERWADDTVAGLISSGISERVIDQVILGLGRLERETGAVVARLDAADSSTPEHKRVLDALRQARLIILDEDGRARVAHEAVLTHWMRATSLFKANAHEVELRDLIEAEAAKWRQEHEAPGFLIPVGLRVAEVELLIESGRVFLSHVARKFVGASIASARQIEIEKLRGLADAARRQRRRTRQAVVAAVVMGVLALVAGLMGWVAVSQGNEATAQKNMVAAGNARLSGALAASYNEKYDFGSALTEALNGIATAQTLGIPVPPSLERELFIAQNDIREKSTFHGTGSLYYTPAVSSDGKVLAGCSVNQFVVWDVTSKRRIGSASMAAPMNRFFSSPSPYLPASTYYCSVALSSDGESVAFAEELFKGSKIHIFNRTLTKVRAEIPVDGVIHEMAYTSDGELLIAALETDIIVIDTSTGQTSWSMPLTGCTSKRNWISMNSGFIACALGSTIRIWNIEKRQEQEISTFEVPENLSLTSIAISASNNRVALISDDGIVRIWDWVLQREIRALAGKAVADDGPASLSCLTFSPDGSLLLYCANDGTAQIFDAKTGKYRATLSGRNAPATRIIAATFSSDGHSVVTASMNGNITFWDSSSVQSRIDWSKLGAIPYASPDRSDQAIPVYSLDLTAIGEGSSAISMRDIQTGATRVTVPFTGSIYAMQTCSSDNRVLILSDNGIEVRDQTLSKTLFKVQKGKAHTATFSADCSKLAFVDSEEIDNTIHVFSSTNDKKELARLELPDNAIAWDGNGSPPPPQLVHSLKFSDDGKCIIAGIDDEILILNAKDLSEVKKIEPHKGIITSVLISPDGNDLVVALTGRTALVWNMNNATSKSLDETIIKGHFSKDGTKLVTISADGAAVIWDAKRFEQIGRVRYTDPIEDASFLENEGRLLTITAVGNVRVSSLYKNLDELIAHSKAIALHF